MAQNETLNYIIRFLADISGANVAKRQTQELNQSFNQLKAGAVSLSRVIGTQVIETFDKMGNSQKRLITTGVDFNNKMVQVVSAVNNFDKVAKITTTSTLGLAENMRRLAERAALTIPLWLALRTVFTSTLGAIGDSAKSIVDIDKALVGLKTELSNLPNVDNFLDRVRSVATAISGETGVATAEVVDILKQFTTSGIDAEVALGALSNTVKASVGTLSNAKELTKTLADVYNVMGKNIKGADNESDKFTLILGKIASLMPTNAFTVDEFAQALKNSAAGAAVAGLSIDELLASLATLSTLMQGGARGGTQFASALRQIQQKGNEVRNFLGVDPSSLSTFELLTQIINKAARQLAETGKVSEDVISIFGAKGGIAINSLTLALGKYNVELGRVKDVDLAQSQEIIADRFGTVSEAIDTQQKRLKVLREEFGRLLIPNSQDILTFFSGLNSLLENFLIPNAILLKNAFENLRTTIVGVVTAGIINDDKTIEALAQNDIGLALQKKAVNDTGELLSDEQLKRQVDGLIDRIRKVGINEKIRLADLLGLDQDTLLGLVPNSIERTGLELQLRNSDFQKLRQGQIDGNNGGGLGSLDNLNPTKTEEEINLRFEDRLTLLDRLKTLGLNDLEIELQKLDIINQQGTADEKRAQKLRVLQQINKEIVASSEQLRNSLEGGLSDLLGGKTNIKDLGKKLGDTFRQGFIDAISGSLTDQLFKTTGIGEIFGGSVFNFRHMADGIGGPIKSGFEVGGKTAYNEIVKGFSDGVQIMNNPNGASGLSLASSGFGSLVPSGGFNASLPGFGNGGFFNQTFGGRPAGAAFGPLTKAQAGATRGQALGVGVQSALTGFSAFQSGGGSQGSLGVASGITGALGGLSSGLAGLGFAGAGTAGATGLGALLGPVGLALTVGSLLFSAFSKTKQSSSETKTTESRVSSKIDITNKQLEVVNRNLIAIDNSLQDVFALPGSTFFSERTDIVDQFSVSSRRGQ